MSSGYELCLAAMTLGPSPRPCAPSGGCTRALGPSMQVANHLPSSCGQQSFSILSSAPCTRATPQAVQKAEMAVYRHTLMYTVCLLYTAFSVHARGGLTMHAPPQPPELPMSTWRRAGPQETTPEQQYIKHMSANMRTCVRRSTRAPAARWSATKSAANSTAPARLTSSVPALGCSSPCWSACCDQHRIQLRMCWVPCSGLQQHV